MSLPTTPTSHPRYLARRTAFDSASFKSLFTAQPMRLGYDALAAAPTEPKMLGQAARLFRELSVSTQQVVQGDRAPTPPSYDLLNGGTELAGVR